MRLHGILSVSVADPDHRCKRKDLMEGIKKCIPDAVHDAVHDLTATPPPTYHFIVAPALYDFPPPILLLL